MPLRGVVVIAVENAVQECCRGIGEAQDGTLLADCRARYPVVGYRAVLCDAVEQFLRCVVEDFAVGAVEDSPELVFFAKRQLTMRLVVPTPGLLIPQRNTVPSAMTLFVKVQSSARRIPYGTFMTCDAVKFETNRQRDSELV